MWWRHKIEPRTKKSGNCQPLKFCHWNLNSILPENCFKVSLLKSFNALHNYDFICLSETFLSPSVSSTLDSLNIHCYNIVRSNHPSGSKSPPIRILKITPLTECLVLEMLYNNELVIVSVIYRSPSQSSQEFQQFKMLFSQLLNDITSKNFHQITFAHINLLIEYPPPYHRLIWDYSNADILNIRKSISSIN